MIWDFWSKHYERLWVQRISLGPTRRAVVERIRPHVKEGLRLLDVGCGTGQLLEDLQGMGRELGVGLELAGVDASRGMVARTRRRLPDLSVRQASLADLAVDTPFDLVTCTHALPYMGDLKSALADFAGLLQPGGLLLLSQAAKETPYDRLALSFVKLTTGPARYHPLERIRRCAEPHFEVVVSGTLDLAFPMPSVAQVLLRKKSGEGR
jgi:2-polyprenyl-3-methyl-5-hydroxy-6-metoxy-1,4-benzoquinol methylase